MRWYIKYNKVLLLFVLLIISFLFVSNKSDNNRDVENEKDNQKLESFYKDKSEYENSFQKVSESTNEKVIAGVVSHHFLAKDLIAQFFTSIDPKAIENVYIIGPDHYKSLSEEKLDLVTSQLDWQTPYGIFNANKLVINDLVKNPNIKIKDTTFKNEHSIYTLVPFAKKVFPNAKIIPLVLKTSDDYQKYFDIGKKAYRSDSLLIISTDFSHEVTKTKANENDIVSIKSLVSKNIDDIGSIESDCKQCIAFLYGFISNKLSRFKLIDNKTSDYFGSQEEENLTSYISGYFIPDNIQILFEKDVEAFNP